MQDLNRLTCFRNFWTRGIRHFLLWPCAQSHRPTYRLAQGPTLVLHLSIGDEQGRDKPPPGATLQTQRRGLGQAKAWQMFQWWSRC